MCNEILNHFNSAIIISACKSAFIKCKKIQSGSVNSANTGTPVISTSLEKGFIFADELICKGYGTCLLHLEGTLISKILKITTLDDETSAHSTILLDGGTGEQELILYFDELQNLNSTDGDAVTFEEGNAYLKGRRVYSDKGLSLDLGANANICCSEIVSGTQGVNIHNSETGKIIIDADKIEGDMDNHGIVYAINDCNFKIKNAKIKNVNSFSASSIGIYIDPDISQPYIEIQNVIIVAGEPENSETIYLAGSNEVNIYNYYLFVNKEIGGAVSPPTLLIGTGISGNYKYIVSSDIV